MGLLMVAQRPLREPQWQTSVQSLPPRGRSGLRFGAGAVLDTIVADFERKSASY